MENIKISCGKGEVELADYDKQVIDSLTKEYRGKIERHFDNIINFEVYVKCFSKKENIKRYQIDARLAVPGHKFEAEADEHVLSDAVHKALKKIISEIEHKIKVSNQGRTPKKPQIVNKRGR